MSQKYSDRARPAYVYLYRPYNDIDVYVEDCTNRAVYEILVGRLVGPELRVSRVHQLGGSSPRSHHRGAVCGTGAGGAVDSLGADRERPSPCA